MKRLPAGCWAVSLVLLAVSCGCSGPPDQQAIEAVEAAGGKVTIDPEGRVTAVDLTGTKANDQLLAMLYALPNIRSLNCSDTLIKGAGLQDLGGLTNLDTLFLNGSQLNDEGLAHVAQFKNLHTLHLGRTEITDAGLPALRHMTQLRTLSLGHTAVTDAGLANLRSLRELGTLILHHTKVTPGGVQQLRRSLPNTRIDL